MLMNAGHGAEGLTPPDTVANRTTMWVLADDAERPDDAVCESLSPSWLQLSPSMPSPRQRRTLGRASVLCVVLKPSLPTPSLVKVAHTPKW